jgi:glucose-6-phosphate isomerase
MIRFDFVKNHEFDFDMNELSQFEMTGWRDNPLVDVNEIYRVRDLVKTSSQVLVVVGIGGSFLGSKSIQDMFSSYFDKGFEVIFAGYSLSSNYLNDLVNYLEDKEFTMNVISKSGSTMEIKTTYNVLKDLLIKKYGDNIKDRVIVTTGDSGFFREESDKYGFYSFSIPNSIGGRYSMFTYAHLFPLAFNINIEEFINGYIDGDELIKDAYNYALNRIDMFNDKKYVETFICYEEKYLMFLEWIKQLFGESEGKEKKGLLPTSVTFSTDLHSLGQFVQDGSPILFETILNVINPNDDVVIPSDKDDLDGLNYLAGKKLSYVNQMAYQGTLKAHEVDGGVPCNIITIEKMDAKTLGYLFYFFMRACAMSAYLLDINPFNQPGVEIYKKNMFHLLGKKGY